MKVCKQGVDSRARRVRSMLVSPATRIRVLLIHILGDARAFLHAGNASEIGTAMIAITTSNSIRVKPREKFLLIHMGA